MVAAAPRRNRTATPERWQQALGRALAEGVTVRQLAGSGAWIATSGSDAAKAYELAVSNGVAHGCTCKAGEFGDPVCCHRAMFYHLVGLLDPAPAPAAPEPTTAPTDAGVDVSPSRPVCAGCGRQGLNLQPHKPLPSPFLCRRCDPPRRSPSAVPPVPAGALDLIAA